MSNYLTVNCTLERHGQQILDIFNDAIRNSTALYDYKDRTMADMEAWFAVKANADFPVIGLESTDGQLLGFGTYGEFRARPAYKYTVEHSLYVHKDHRGKGLGGRLLQLVIAAAESQGKHAIIGGIDAENTGSIALHERARFKLVGTLPQVGFKFGRWLDLVFYQLTLNTPAHPQDG